MKFRNWMKVGAALLALAMVGSMSFAAYAAPSASHSKAKASATRTKPAGSLVFSDYEFPDTLSPYLAGLVVDILNIDFTTDSLFGFNTKAKIFPDLVTKVPSQKNGLVSKNGKTITIHLKPGIKWATGKPITAQDIKFSWQVSMQSGYCGGTCDSITSISVPNKTTDVFHFKTAFAPALQLAVGGFGLVPSKFSNSAGKWTNVKQAVNVLTGGSTFNFESSNYPTTGPYEVASFNNNDRITFRPNPFYSAMNKGAYLKKIVFVVYSSQDDMIAAAAQHQTDLTQDYQLAQLPSLNKQKSKFKTAIGPALEFEHFEFNNSPTYNGAPNPVANTKVRQALALSLDKIGLIKASQTVSTSVAKSVEASNFFAYEPSFKFAAPYTDTSINGTWDPIAKKFVQPGTSKAIADAKKLLAETPYKGGFKLDADTTTGNIPRATELSVALKSFSKIGVTLVPHYVPASTLFSRVWSDNGTLETGAYQIADFATASSVPDPGGWNTSIEYKYCPRGGDPKHLAIDANDSCINNPVFTTLFKKANATFDSKVRQKYFTQIQQVMAKNSYWIPLYYRVSIWTTDGKLKDFSINPLTAGATWNAFNWRVSS